MQYAVLLVHLKGSSVALHTSVVLAVLGHLQSAWQVVSVPFALQLELDRTELIGTGGRRVQTARDIAAAERTGYYVMQCTM